MNDPTGPTNSGGADGDRGAIDEPGLVRRMEHASARLGSQHRQLAAFFSVVTDSLSDASEDAVRVSFERLADAVKSHLTMEENVYLVTLRRLHPNLSETIRGLVDEHQGFRRRIEALEHLLGRGLVEPFAETFALLTSDFEDHERREEAILSSLTRQ